MSARRATSKQQRDRIVAYHEAGHAVVKIHFGVRFKQVWLSNPKTGRGRVDVWPHSYLISIADYESEAIIKIAGPLAQRRYSPRSPWYAGAGYKGTVNGVKQFVPDSDLDVLGDCLTALGYLGNKDRDAAVNKLVRPAGRIVRELWPAIKVVARALLARKKLRATLKCVG